MMYAYMTLEDGTEVTHSHIMNVENQEVVEVHFERPIENGFDSARCVLPQYQGKFNEGYSAKEIEAFEEFLHCNAHLIFKFAGRGEVVVKC